MGKIFICIFRGSENHGMPTTAHHLSLAVSGELQYTDLLIEVDSVHDLF